MNPRFRHTGQVVQRCYRHVGIGLLWLLFVASLAACNNAQPSPTPIGVTASSDPTTSVLEPTPAATPRPTPKPVATLISIPTNTSTPSPTVTPLAVVARDVLDSAISTARGDHSGHIEGEFTLEADLPEATLVYSMGIVGVFQTPSSAHLTLTYSVQGTGSVDVGNTKVDIVSRTWTQEIIAIGDEIYLLDSFGGSSRHKRENIELSFELFDFLKFDLFDSNGEISARTQELDGERVYHLTGPAAPDKSYPVIDRAPGIDGVVDYRIGIEDQLLRRLDISIEARDDTPDAEPVRLTGFVALSNYGESVDIQPPVPEGADDHGNSPGSATDILVGEPVTATVDTWLDLDYFRFQADEGRLYHIVVSDHDVEYGTQSTLFGTDGVTPETTASQSSDQLGTRIVWQAPASDTYYLRVESGNEDGDPYTLLITLMPEADDYGDDSSSAHEIGFDEAIEGLLGQLNDRDYFKFTATEGQVYRIDASPHLARSEPDVVLHGPNGPLQEASSFSRGGIDTKRILWVAPSQGDYYISLEFRHRHSLGSYTLRVVPITNTLDDHGDGATSATGLSVGETVGGALDYEYDLDYFKFTAEEGQGYRVNIDYGTVRYLSLDLYASDSFTPEPLDKYTQADRDGHGLLWMAREAGTYHLEVKSLFGHTGEYTITVAAIVVGPDDHGNDSENATDIAIGETIQGSMDNEFDIDYFRFVAEEGKEYRLSVAHQTLENSRVAVYSADGITRPLPYFSSSSSTRGSTAKWMAESSSEYFIEVDSRSGSLGAYTIVINEEDG